MPKQKKPISTERINMRLPKPLYDNVARLGEALGYDTIGGAARYFMTVGVQQSMGQINSGRSLESNAQFQASFPDMFKQLFAEIAAEEKPAAKGRRALPTTAEARRPASRKR